MPAPTRQDVGRERDSSVRTRQAVAWEGKTVAALIGVIFFLLAARHVRGDMAAAKRRHAAGGGPASGGGEPVKFAVGH